MSSIKSNLIVPCAVLGVAIAVAGFFVSNTLYKSRVALNIITVKGLAERRVDADHANWRIAYTVTGKSKRDIPDLFTEAEKNKETILSYLKQAGVTEEEITVGVIDYSNKEYRDKDRVLLDESHYLTGIIEIETDRVAIINPLRMGINKLMVQGIDINNYSPQYMFTKLNEIKPDMLKEATKNAKIAATEFAENADSKVGKIRSARQGGFTIVDVGESYGDERQLTKDVRVVTTAEFYID